MRRKERTFDFFLISADVEVHDDRRSLIVSDMPPTGHRNRVHVKSIHLRTEVKRVFFIRYISRLSTLAGEQPGSERVHE